MTSNLSDNIACSWLEGDVFFSISEKNKMIHFFWIIQGLSLKLSVLICQCQWNWFIGMRRFQNFSALSSSPSFFLSLWRPSPDKIPIRVWIQSGQLLILSWFNYKIQDIKSKENTNNKYKWLVLKFQMYFKARSHHIGFKY